MKYLLFEVMFLANTFHGRAFDEREWPVSPMRMFSASTEPAGWHGGEEQQNAMRWLERLGPPEIVAPQAQEMTDYVVTYPDNCLDMLPARSWSTWLSRSKRSSNVSETTLFPSYIEDDSPLTYVWKVGEGSSVQQHVETLQSIAHHVHALGRSEDTVACRVRLVGDTEVQELKGNRWVPSRSSRTNDEWTRRLRVPVPGSFDSLEQRFRLSREQVQKDFVRRPPEPLFEVLSYHRSGAQRCHLIGLHDQFGKLLRIDPRDTITIAAMMRHEANEMAKSLGMDDEWARRYICGHVEKGDQHRVAYVPIPSVGRYASGSISQVMLVEPAGARNEDFARVVEHLQRQRNPSSSGCGKYVAWLGRGDWEATWRFRKPSTVFTSVSPVILPGFDSHSYAKAEKLAIKSLTFAGIYPLVEDFALTRAPHWRGSYHASSYAVSDRLTPKSRYHMRVVFREKIKGPLFLGDGRYRGLGLFAASGS